MASARGRLEQENVPLSLTRQRRSGPSWRHTCLSVCTASCSCLRISCRKAWDSNHYSSCKISATWKPRHEEVVVAGGEARGGVDVVSYVLYHMFGGE